MLQLVIHGSGHCKHMCSYFKAFVYDNLYHSMHVHVNIIMYECMYVCIKSLRPIKSSLKQQKPCTKVLRLVLNPPYKFP